MNLTKINEVVYIPLDKIEVNPFQPRKHFGDEDIDKLANSIEQYGVLQPISVRRDGDRYQLIIGERRTRASIKAGLTHIPAILVDVEDNDSAVAALIENLLRVDLNFLEEAEAIIKLMEEHGLSQTELSKTLGMSQSSISNKIRVFGLPDEVKIRISEGRLSERHARALLKLSDVSEMVRMVDRIVEEGLSVKRTEELIDRKLRSDDDAKKRDRMKRAKTSISYRIYANTIRQAFDAVSESNPKISIDEVETDDYFEMTVRIPKKE
jgi:ParB family transcriptional regulator, chromosome partitioning protein